jgi:hypothetical protein
LVSTHQGNHIQFTEGGLTLDSDQPLFQSLEELHSLSVLDFSSLSVLDFSSLSVLDFSSLSVLDFSSLSVLELLVDQFQIQLLLAEVQLGHE